MKRLLSRKLWLALLLAVPAARAARAAESAAPRSLPAAAPEGPPDAVSDPAAFAAELRSLRDSLVTENISPQKLAEIRANLPDRWRVRAGGEILEISSDPLRASLEAAEKDAEKRKTRVEQAGQWLDTLAENAEGYGRAGPAPDAQARPVLQEILRRPEFAGVGKANFIEQFQGWLARKLAVLLGKLFGKIAGYPIAGSLLFWLLIFGAAVWLALFLFRYGGRQARLEELQALEYAAMVRTWQEWIGRARQAAARGDFREAIHAVYWAGITNLADRGMLPSGRTYTPREYLRLLASADGTTLPLVAVPVQRESLALLTARLESVWYGRGKADAEDFRTTLKQAEALGCRLE